jgi:hypothetical protein
VDLSGEWVVEKTPRLAGGFATTRRWKGLARASEPLVVLAVVASPIVVQWGKSEAATDPDGCPITLALFPYDNLGLDVQVNLTAGGGGADNRTSVISVDYLPPIDRIQRASGELLRLVSIDGRPEIEAASCSCLVEPSEKAELATGGLEDQNRPSDCYPQ